MELGFAEIGGQLSNRKSQSNLHYVFNPNPHSPPSGRLDGVPVPEQATPTALATGRREQPALPSPSPVPSRPLARTLVRCQAPIAPGHKRALLPACESTTRKSQA